MFVFVGFCSLVHFFTIDEISVLYDANFISVYLADDTNAKSRTWEWLTEYEFFRNAKFQTCFTHFIFEQITQRLDDFLEIYEVR